MAASLVLLPLLVGITYLARMQEVVHASDLAARYVAFDALSQSDQPAQWRDLETLQNEVRQRFFGDPGEPIISPGSTTPALADFGSPPLTTLEDGSLMLGDNASNVRLTTDQGNLGSSIGDGFTPSSDSDPFDEPVRTALGLGANGIHTVNVNVEPWFVGRSLQGSRLFADYGLTDLRLKRSMSSLHAGWAARSRDDVVARLTSDPLLLPSLQVWPELTLSGPLVPAVEVPGPVPGPQLTPWRDIVQQDRRQ